MVNNNAPDLELIAKRYRVLLKNSRDAIGIMAVELFNESFQAEGQIMGNGLVNPWPKRGFGPPSRDSAKLLKKRGGLQRSITYRRTGEDVVTIQSNKPYSKLMQEGGIIKVTAKMRKFFWAMYYKYAVKVVYNIADRGVKNTKGNNKQNAEAEFWFKMAMAKQVTIKARPFLYDTPELSSRMDDYFEAEIANLFIDLK